MLTSINHQNKSEKENFNPFRSNNKCKSLTTVRHLLTQMDLATKKRHYSQKKKQVYLDRQQIKKQMKQKWKDPGYCNVEFSGYKALKGKFLNQWQIQRIFLATRSYQTPKDFKGYKQSFQSRQFPKVTKQMYSQKFQKYLSKVEQKNQETLFNPKKMYTQSAISQSRTLKKGSRQKKSFQAFSTQNKSFGMGTVTWKSGQNYKFKTINN